MSTQLISPGHARHLDIRCTVEDVALSNVAIHVVFFFDRRLDAGALADSFARALTNLPVFAGRLALVGGTLRLRCTGQGAPFTVASSGQTLSRAIRSVSESDGGWLIDAVNGPTARWGFGPLCRVRVTHLADDATAIGFSWHHTIGDMQTAMHFMNAWAATAADRPLAEPVIVEDRVAYLDAQLPAGGAREPGVRCLGFAETARSLVSMARNWRTLRTWTAYFSDDEIAGLRQECGTARRVSVNDVVCAQVAEALMTADSAVNHRVLALAVNVRNRLGLDPMLVGNIV
ncbi:acyltransferase, partial [Mycolicibacterium sp. CBMA 361]